MSNVRIARQHVVADEGTRFAHPMRQRRFEARHRDGASSGITQPIAVAALATMCFLAYSIVSVSNYERFATRSYDLGIFEQTVRRYAHLQAPIVHIKGAHLNVLGDHFSPLLAVLAPLYRLFPTALTLEIAQAALFALSVIPVTRLAVRHTSAARGLAIGAAYGLAWGLQQAVDVDFHEICLAVPLLAFSLCALVDRRWLACALWASPLVLVKEDLGLTVAVIGVCVMTRGQRRTGGTLAACGVVASAITILVVMPAIDSTGRYPYWNELLPGGRSHTPLALARSLFDPATKLVTLVMIFGITGFLALRSSICLAVLPTLAWRFLAETPSYWGTDWHYNAVLMPIVFVALVDATIATRASTRPWLRAYGVNVASATLAAAIALSGQFPLSRLIDPATYHGGQRVAEAREALAQITSGSVVETDVGLMAHLTSRCDVYFITRAGNPPPDFLVIASAWSPSVTDAAAYAERLHPGVRYQLVYSSSSYQVAHRSPQLATTADPIERSAP